jgi:hypothetical protein
MLSPRRHFIFDFFLIINRLSFHLPDPRALSFVILILFCSSFQHLNAQVLSVNNPNIQASITDEQVNALGKTGKITDFHPVTLNFEGLGNLDEISRFYNGGTSHGGFEGVNCGITFSPGTMSIIDAQHGGSGNFTRDLQPNTVIFSPADEKITIDVEKGFKSEFALFYSSSESITVSIYDSTGGYGNILVTNLLQPDINPGQQKTGAYYDSWLLFRVAFPGTAKSVVIIGKPDKCAFDDITFGDSKSAGGTVKTSTGGSKGFSEMLTTPQATTEKGNFFLVGASRFGISVGAEKSKSGGSTVDGSESTYYDLDFLPKAGYFIIDNLVGGLFIDLELYNNKSKSGGYGYKGTTFIIGPFARYYVPVNEKILPFAEAQVGFGLDHYSSRSSSSSDWYKTKENIFTYRLGAGATYFINDVVGFDMFMGFLHDAYKYKDSGDESESSDSKSIYNEFNLQLGIVVVL